MGILNFFKNKKLSSNESNILVMETQQNTYSLSESKDEEHDIDIIAFTSNITNTIANNILDAVHFIDTENGFTLGKTNLVLFLKGDKKQWVVKKNNSELLTSKFFGILDEIEPSSITNTIDLLIAQDFLFNKKINNFITVISITKNGISSMGKVSLQIDKSTDILGFELDIIEDLRKIRYQLSKKHSVPLHYICSNDVLFELAERKPRTISELMEVRGFGGTGSKANTYGQDFINYFKK